MPNIIEIQTSLQNLTNKRITYTDIGNIFGTGKANISLRAKNKSQVTEKEIKLLEHAYNVDLTSKPTDKLTPEQIQNITKHVKDLQEYIDTKQKEFDEKLKEIKSESKHAGVSASANDCVAIPVRGNLAASLGQGIIVDDETETGKYWLSTYFIKSLGVGVQNIEMIPSEGDSMEPTITGGSLLLVNHAQKEIIDGKIYCVRLNNQLMAKRLQFIPPSYVKVISDNNEKYEAFKINLSKLTDDFEIIGQVMWWATIAR